MVSAPKRVFLGASTAPSRVESDQGLAVRPFRMLVLHMGVKRRVRQISFVAEGAFEITSVDVVFAAPFLFLFERAIGTGDAVLLTVADHVIVLCLRVLQFLPRLLVTQGDHLIGLLEAVSWVGLL